MLASSIPLSFTKAFGASAGASYIRAIPAASQISITPGAASLTDGFPPLNFLPVAAGGVPMSGKDLNGILNEITAAIQWQQVAGLPVYNSTFSTAIGGYPAGAVLRATSTTGMWLSTADNNTTNPETGGAGWQLIGISAAQVQQRAFNYAHDTGIVNAYIVTLAPIPTLIDGMEIGFSTPNTNTITNPTVTINGTTLLITGPGSVALALGQIPANAPVTVVYNTYGSPHLELQGIPASLVMPSITAVRQTVQSGPINGNGEATFGGTVGSTTVTAAGTLTVTAAGGFGVNGQIDRVGSITNPSWTGLNVNGVMYLYLDIAANNTCMPAANTLMPVYTMGAAPGITAGQLTFNIQQAIGYSGSGAAAPQSFRVAVGEVLVVGGVVSTITWYALNRKYVSPLSAIAVGTAYNLNHNLGIIPSCNVQIEVVCQTAEQGFAVGDVAVACYYNNNYESSILATKRRNSCLYGTQSSGLLIAGFNGLGGEQISITPAYWLQRVTINNGVM